MNAPGQYTLNAANGGSSKNDPNNYNNSYNRRTLKQEESFGPGNMLMGDGLVHQKSVQSSNQSLPHFKASIKKK